MTLTLRHDGLGLTTNLQRLYESFKKLRKHPVWKTTQTGGVAFLEIKRSRDKQSWHPHFHVLTQGKFLRQDHLAAAWKSITVDSHIVDIRLVTDQKHAINYVTKYASKPFDQSLFDDQTVLVEAMTALKGRKTVVAFGNWKGVTLAKKTSLEVWENLGTLENMLERAMTGESDAVKILAACCGARAAALLAIKRSKTPTATVEARASPVDSQIFFWESDDSSWQPLKRLDAWLNA